jgi:hypothetical protein
MSEKFSDKYVSIEQICKEYGINKGGVLKIIRNYELEVSKIGGQQYLNRTSFEEKMSAELNSASLKRKETSQKKKDSYAELKNINRMVNSYFQTKNHVDVKELLQKAVETESLKNLINENSQSALIQSIKSTSELLNLEKDSSLSKRFFDLLELLEEGPDVKKPSTVKNTPELPEEKIPSVNG